MEQTGSLRRPIGITFRIVFKFPNPKGKLKISIEEKPYRNYSKRYCILKIIRNCKN
jgi:hypothetical protein